MSDLRIFEPPNMQYDNSTAYKILSLSAQLNVEADHLASAFYCKGPLSTQNILMTPSCQAKLSIQGVSITGKYNNTLICAYTKPPITSHIYKIISIGQVQEQDQFLGQA